MSLDYHVAVDQPAAFTSDTAAAAKTKLNDNFTLVTADIQGVSDAVDDAVATLFGSGWTVAPTVSYSGASLGITFGTGKALIGHEIAYAGGVATVLASQTGASLYFCQDGTWATTLPTTKAYMVAGTYTSDGSGVTAWTISAGILLPTLTTVTDAVVINIPASPGYVTQYIDHSALGTFSIPGFTKLLISPTTDFTVALAYSGMVVSTSNTATDPPPNETEEGFWVTITRKSGYYYAGQPDATLTYTRTGIGIATL